MKKFDLQKYLKYLNYADNPNGEDIKKLKEYNKLIINLYKHKKSISIMDNYKLWLGLGIGEELAKKVKNTTEDFLKNKTLVSKVVKLYDTMVKDYKIIF